MSHIANRFVVVLDANVLYPFRLRDILLTLCEAGLFRGRWTEAIVQEWSQNLLVSKPSHKEKIHRTVEAMRRAFPEAWVDGYEDLIPTIHLPDENDRHVVAAAMRCGAQLIVTENLKDFPASEIEKFDIEAVSADEFLSGIFELYPAECVFALRNMRERYVNPELSPSEFVFDLIAKGMPKLAAKLKPNKELL